MLSMVQYEYEEAIVRPRVAGGRRGWCAPTVTATTISSSSPAHPPRSRRQGADTVSHVLLRWHGSCLGELRYPQKARQLIHSLFLSLSLFTCQKPSFYLTLIYTCTRDDFVRFIFVFLSPSFFFILRYIYTYCCYRPSVIRPLFISRHARSPLDSLSLSFFLYHALLPPYTHVIRSREH